MRFMILALSCVEGKSRLSTKAKVSGAAGPPVAATSSASGGALRSSFSGGSTFGPSFMRWRAGSSISRSGPNGLYFPG